MKTFRKAAIGGWIWEGEVFEQTFKNIDNVLRTEAGCQNELDYIEQTSWIIFLKYLDDLEADREAAADLADKTYKPILAPDYRWRRWAVPKTKSGEIDHHKALTGDDLSDFVSKKLFPYLAKFKTDAEHPDTIEYKIGEIFGELRNKVHSGYNLREILNRVDELRFRSKAEKHEMSALYEDKIKNMGNAGRNGGEYYTPRPLIRAIVQVVAPQIGERIYDPAAGSAGFLCEAFEYLKASKKQLSTHDWETLQKRTFYGKEKKSLAYVIGTMNMILHGIEAPNIIHTNTLTENISDIQEKDRYNVVLANPPFGGSESKQVQHNFPNRSGETAYLFLQHFIKSLKAGGRAGIVIKSTFLHGTDNASVSLRQLLLESCSLHTILDCPSGTFHGAGVKTAVLFFQKGRPTQSIWYYQLDPGRNLGKSNPLNEEDLKEFVAFQSKQTLSEKSWIVSAEALADGFDLSVRNPHRKDDADDKPNDLIAEMEVVDATIAESFDEVKTLVATLGQVFTHDATEWRHRRVAEIATHSLGKMLDKAKNRGTEKPYLRNLNVRWFEFDLTDLLMMKFLPEEEEKYTAVSGDVLVCEGGYPGRAAMWTEPYPIHFQKALHRVRFHDPMHSKWFIYYIFYCDQIGALRRHFTGAGIQHFTGEALAKFEIPLPPQEKMAEQIKVFDELVGALERMSIANRQKARAVDELRVSVLREAFRGAV